MPRAKSANDVLGSIVWWTIVGDETGLMPVSRDQLLEWFIQRDLDTSYLPGPVKGIDAFRAASSEIDFTYQVDGRPVHITCIEAIQTHDYVTRHLMRTVVDPRGAKMTGQKVGELNFYRPTRTAKGRRHGTEEMRVHLSTHMGDAERARISEAVDIFKRRYDSAKNLMSATAMRTVIRDYLTIKLNAIAVKKASGIYFVHAQHEQSCRDLDLLLRTAHPECRLDCGVLTAGNANRDLIARAVQRDVLSQVAVLLHDVNARVPRGPRGPVRPDRLVPFRMRYAQLVTSTEDHAWRLDRPLPWAADALERVESTLDRLSDPGGSDRGP